MRRLFRRIFRRCDCRWIRQLDGGTHAPACPREPLLTRDEWLLVGCGAAPVLVTVTAWWFSW